MRVPAVALAGAFVGGIVSGIAPPLESTVALSVSFLAAAVSTCRGGRRLAATVLLLASYFFLGTSSRLLVEQTFERQPLLRFYNSIGKAGFENPCFLEGTLRVEPEQRPRATKLLMNVTSVRVGGTTSLDGLDAGNVSLNVRGEPELRRSLSSLDADDRVSLWATLRRPRGFQNPGGFDLEAYLARRGISMYGSVKSALLVERGTPAFSASPGRLGSRAREFVRRRIREAFRRIGVGEEVPGVAVALLIGDRSLIPPWAEKLYQESGTFHVIVISGAHVALLVWVLYRVLRWSGIDQTPALRMLLIALPLYAVLCGGRPSVVRAVTMCCAIVGAKLLSLEVSAFNRLAASALLLLACRPLDIYDPGFQLSFAATVSIIGLGRPMSHFFGPRLGGVGHALGISIAAQAAVVPILAWHFQRLTPAAVLASIVAMPLAAGSLVAAALLLLVAPLPWIGEALAWLVWLQIKGLALCGQVAIALPGGSMRVPSPGWLWLWCYFARHGREGRRSRIASPRSTKFARRGPHPFGLRPPGRFAGGDLPWCINTGKSLIPLTLRFLAQKRNLLIPLELSRVMHQGSLASVFCDGAKGCGLYNRLARGCYLRIHHDVPCPNPTVGQAAVVRSGSPAAHTDLMGASAIKCW